MHSNDNHHDHAHTCGNAHEHGHTHDGGTHSHDGLLKSKAEAAAFLQYTLSHNAHHEEELDGLVHSLRHLGLAGEADEIESCIGTLAGVNARLETVLKRLM